MAKPIHGGVYLFIGIFISAISFYFNSKGMKFTLFIYAGIIISIFGLIKLLILRSKKEKPVKQNNFQQQNQNIQKQQPQDMVRYCPRCRFELRKQDRFCSACGQRIY